MIKRVVKMILNSSWVLYCGYCIPNIGKLAKLRNILINAGEAVRHVDVMTAYPTHVRIAPIAVCNYRCLFCEIHKDNALYPSRERNEFDLELLENYRPLLSKCYRLFFFGGSEEPLLCRNFASICTDLKSRYGTRLSVTTNASMLTKEIADKFVDMKFDYLFVSYHAGTEESYKFLMTGSKHKVDMNLEYLFLQKNNAKTKLPVVDFNYALQKFNAPDHAAIADTAKRLGVRKVHITRYYGGRNKLDEHNASYDKDPAAGNKALDDIYAYARHIGMELSPVVPDYWRENADYEQNDCNKKDMRSCREPWKSIHFNPVLDDKECHYVGVCNRIELFKINYREFDMCSGGFFELWNHPVLRYLRKTVNSTDSNPICRHCKNPNLGHLRNIDPDSYAAKRDAAVEEFFSAFAMLHGKNVNPVKGLTLLHSNPHADKKFSVF